MTLVPPSIRQFRLVYGLVVLLSALNAVLIWPSLTATLAANEALGGARLAVQWIVVLVGLLIPLLIWWFAGYRRSRVARILLALIVGWALFSLARTMLAGQLAFDAVGSVRLVALLLQVVALALLFRPDTRSWFARRSSEPFA